jgi:hypothetical protein
MALDVYRDLTGEYPRHIVSVVVSSDQHRDGSYPPPARPRMLHSYNGVQKCETSRLRCVRDMPRRETAPTTMPPCPHHPHGTVPCHSRQGQAPPHPLQAHIKFSWLLDDFPEKSPPAAGVLQLQPQVPRRLPQPAAVATLSCLSASGASYAPPCSPPATRRARARGWHS